MKTAANSTQKVAPLILAFLMLFAVSCKKKYTPLSVDPAFAAYVISFPSGLLSNTAKIQVRLVQPVQEAVPGKELSSNPFSMSPDIKGKARWVDNQTIEFVPEKLLTSGEIYTVDFELDRFVKVPHKLKTLTFRFQVIKQNIRFDFSGITPYNESDVRMQKINGSLLTADFADATLLEKSFQIDGVDYPYVRWQHSENGRVHTFIVDSVPRKERPYQIQFSWKGGPINAAAGEFKFEMPALAEFKIIHTKITSNPSSQLEIYFSDPLSRSQDMSGLFKLTPSVGESVVVAGNLAKIIPSSSVSAEEKVTVFSGVKNYAEKPLGRDYNFTVKFVTLAPQVELIGEGVIVPHTDGILFPFRAVSLSAVDVRIIKIFENNIVQFLQSNQFNGNHEIKRVGRVVYNQEVQLTSNQAIDYSEWNNFSLDLSKLISTEPGAIYRVEISFRQKHSLYSCPNGGFLSKAEQYAEPQNMNQGYNEPPSESYWGYYDDGEEIDYDGYNWNEKDDPCKPSYYMSSQRRVSRNVLASDFGIIAKAGTNNEYFLAVTDLRTTDPLPGVEIEFRNLQNQPMGSVKTNSDGLCSIKMSDKPFVLVAKKGQQRGYLRLDNASSLSLSMFDVNGEEIKKGIKGFLYGERGVWRPGDLIYLTFVLEDKNNQLPPDHPVVFELYNPSGLLAQRTVKTSNLNGFYTLILKMQASAPTGTWTAKVQVGGSTFVKNIRIETVKPNRMKINLSFPGHVLKKGIAQEAKLQVNWLHGAPASNCNVKVEATAAAGHTEFSAWRGYVFDDQTKKMVSQDITLFNGKTNPSGTTSVPVKFDFQNDAPGMVAVQMKTTVFEGGGDFSTDRQVIQYSPYKSYVGVKMPEGKGWNNALYSDETNLIPLAVVNESGHPVDSKLKIEIFNIYWRWWWEQTEESNLSDFITNQNTNLLKTDYIATRNGRAMYPMNLGGEYWGRKLIRITDLNSGHSSSAVFYTTYKGWWSNAGNDNPGGAEMLAFQTDKKSYGVAEKVSVELPVTHSGKALISIETGSRVLKTFWFEPTATKPRFSFETTAEMAPNAYIHVSYIQPHNHAKNDFPIRMYGVQAISVEDKNTYLEPMISVPAELKPMSKFSVGVSEKSRKPMTYTIAVVDEGLLDLTRFKTPNPWDTFYAREALGVRTWDLYKYVAGTFSGKLAGLYAIGGDQYFDKKGKENNNRFKPVVLFQGPYYIAAGQKKIHSFVMPNYVGSVRIMVVAGESGAYGAAEKAVPVRQSLMVLPTVPRVVSPTEEIKIPVTVFALSSKVKNVSVHIATDKNFAVMDGATRQVSFDKEGDKLVEFKLKVGKGIALGKIAVTAVSGTNKTTSETQLQIRQPNPPASYVKVENVAPGKSVNLAVAPFGIQGTNSGTLEVSRLYPVNLQKRLQYLVQYPHGCIEQITSAAFPQLFLQNVANLTPQRKTEIENNIKACLHRLKSYQLSNGGFGYWPNDSYGVSEWGTSYAGHFMLEAKNLGYELPVGLLDPWISYQTREANNWKPTRKNYGGDLEQAYRLYTLALAKRPSLSAMNLMRETPEIDQVALWRLAGAYALSGKPDIGLQIVNKLSLKVSPREDFFTTYGSSLRDEAMMLETLTLLKEHAKAKAIVADVAFALGSSNWLSTQSTAYMLLAISKYIGNGAGAGSFAFVLKQDGKATNVNSDKAVYLSDLNMNGGGRKVLTLTNKSKQTLFVRTVIQGVPLMSTQSAISENIILNVKYFNMKGALVNPLSLKQGTQFYADITLTHPGIRLNYNDLSLSLLFPSGWEIINSRMDLIQTAKANTDQPRYQDIRDDRVYMYFDLEKGKSKKFRVLLQAAYLGKFYLPSMQCEAMYDNTIRAYTKSQWVEVVR